MNDICKNIHDIPILPVPTLEETCDKYLEWVCPLLNKAQYSKSYRIINDFFNSEDAKILQKNLVEKSMNRDDSWLAEWWINNAYLSSNGPVTPECNAGLEIEFEELKEMNSLQKVASIIYTLAKVYLKYKETPNNYIENKGVKISLDQLHGIFASARVFGKMQDEYYINSKHSNEISFMYKNHIFNIEVIVDNEVASIRYIYNTLCEIATNFNGKDVNINFVTASCDRRQGYYVYKKLLDSNSKNLERIYNSIAVVSYDDIHINDYKESISNSYCNKDYFNRWLGKGLSVILTRDTCNIIGDHTYIDGGTEVYVIEQIKNELSIMNEMKNSSKKANYEELNFEIDMHLEFLYKCRSDFENYLDATEYTLVNFNMDRMKLKEKGILSLDGFVQLLFQYASKQAFEKIVPTYESVDIRNYFRGRTECLRPVSKQSVKVVKMLEEKDYDNLLNSIIESTNEHYRRLKFCKCAKGVNRHLLGLQLMATELKINVELFNDISYKVISENKISTSSLSSFLINYFYFQQVKDDGFGISYQLGDNCKLIISNRKENSKQKDVFVNSFRNILKIISDELGLY